MTHLAVAMPVEVHHLVLPGLVVRRAVARVGESVKRFLKRNRWAFELDTILTINGRPVLRALAGWKQRRIAPGDVVRFISRPFGGNSGAKQIAGLVALIALTVFATWVTGPAGLALGSGLMAAGVKAAIVAGGMFLFNTLVMPRPGNSSDEDALRSFNAGGNVARPLETIPSAYGSLQRDLNYASLPYKTYAGNDEFFHGLFMVGCGTYDHEALLIEDVPFWSAEAAEEDGTGTGSGGTIPGDAHGWANDAGRRPNSPGVLEPFDDIQVEFIEPGQPVTLFPTNVHQSPDVSGLEFDSPSSPGGGWSPWFPVCNAGATTQLIHLDIALPNGHARNNHSTLSYYAVEIAPIDNAGTIIGAVQHTDRTISAHYRKPHRFTDSFPQATPARYALRFRRNNEPETEGNTDIYAASLRAELPTSTVFGNGTMVAVRIKATKQMSDYSSRRIRYRGTRKLPVWTGEGWETLPTRNPIWAAIDYRSNTAWGGRLPLTRIDLDAFIEQAAAADTRGDCFDYEFSSAVKVGEGFDTILAACRSKGRWLGDVLSLVRDEWRETPRMVITDREMEAGSFSLTPNFRPASSPDGLIVNYIDRETWRPAQVVIPIGSSPTRPLTEELRGITSRAHATREGVFKWNAHVKRRVAPSFTMMLDGHLLFLGDHVDIQSRTPQGWGAPHAVVGLAGSIIRLPRAPDWDEATMYAVVRDRMGQPFGPFRVTQGTSPRHLVANEDDLATILAGTGKTLADALDRAADAVPPTLVMGKAFDFLRRCQIVSCEPRGDKAQIAGFLDYEEVHDPGEVEEAPRPEVPPFPAKLLPRVSSINARLQQVLFETRLVADWAGSPTATRYVVEVLYEGGDRALTVYDGPVPACDVVVDNFTMQVRVVPYGDRGAGYPSPWKLIDPIGVTLPAGVVSLPSFAADALAKTEKARESIAGMFTEMLSRAHQERLIRAEAEGNFAQVREQLEAVVTDQEAFAEALLDVTAQFNSVSAETRFRMTAYTGIPGVAARIAAEARVGSTGPTGETTWHPAGWAIDVVEVDGSPGTYRGIFTITADYLFIRNTAGDLIAYFDTIANIFTLDTIRLRNAIIDGEVINDAGVKVSARFRFGNRLYGDNWTRRVGRFWTVSGSPRSVAPQLRYTEDNRIEVFSFNSPLGSYSISPETIWPWADYIEVINPVNQGFSRIWPDGQLEIGDYDGGGNWVVHVAKSPAFKPWEMDPFNTRQLTNFVVDAPAFICVPNGVTTCTVKAWGAGGWGGEGSSGGRGFGGAGGYGKCDFPVVPGELIRVTVPLDSSLFQRSHGIPLGNVANNAGTGAYLQFGGQPFSSMTGFGGYGLGRQSGGSRKQYEMATPGGGAVVISRGPPQLGDGSIIAVIPGGGSAIGPFHGFPGGDPTGSGGNVGSMYGKDGRTASPAVYSGGGGGYEGGGYAPNAGSFGDASQSFRGYGGTFYFAPQCTTITQLAQAYGSTEFPPNASDPEWIALGSVYGKGGWSNVSGVVPAGQQGIALVNFS